MTARNQGVQSARTRREYDPGGCVVNTIDLSEDLPVLREARANRILIEMDIYRDSRHEQATSRVTAAAHKYSDATTRV
jgi:hypothetical protein